MTVPAKPGATCGELTTEHDEISRRLVAARGNADALPGFPGRLPETLREAYAIQAASIERWPDDIAGWKVGMIPESDRLSLGAERLAGPIFRSSVFGIEPGSSRTMPIYSGGFAAIEAEFVLQIARTIEPTGRDFSDEELAALVASLHVGAEIASSPMAGINILGPSCVVCDFGNNAGLIVGPDVPNWPAMPLDSLTAKVSVDEVVVGTASAGAIQGGLLQALRFLVDLCADRGLAIAEGTFVSSGAVTGIHEVTVESKASVDFGDFGSFDVVFESMQPGQ